MSTARTKPRRHPMRFKGMLLHYGEVPPESGPARVGWDLHRASEHLARAHQQYGTALIRLVGCLPGGLGSLPPSISLHHLHDDERARRVGRERVTAWFALRQELDRHEFHLLIEKAPSSVFDQEWDQADMAARAAVQDAATAFHLFEDAELELDTFDTATSPDVVRDRQTLAGLRERAHQVAHLAAEMVGGLFGCRLEYDDGDFYSSCALERMHVPLGLSAGFTSARRCSICGVDPVDCDHLAGRSYPVVAKREQDGTCTVCSARQCGHLAGSVHDTPARIVTVPLSLLESSIVSRPRDPRCRITSVSVDPADLIAVLGRLPEPGEEVWTHTCMFPCTGFGTRDLD